MAALIAAARDPAYPAEIVLVMSNRPDAPGLTLARDAGVAARGDRSSAIQAATAPRTRRRSMRRCATPASRSSASPAIMRLLTPLPRRCLAGPDAQHPSEPAAGFPGLHTHARALAAGVKLHGCTVHLVTQTMDEGPILAQAAVPVLPGDTAAMLADRVLVQEHRIYPLALQNMAEGDEGFAELARGCAAHPGPRPADVDYQQRGPMPCLK